MDYKYRGSHSVIPGLFVLVLFSLFTYFFCFSSMLLTNLAEHQFFSVHVKPLIGTLKPQSNGPLYGNMVIGTLAVDGCAVTFGTARRGLGRLQSHPVPSSLYQM